MFLLKQFVRCSDRISNSLPMYFGVSENSLVCLFIIKLFEVFFVSEFFRSALLGPPCKLSANLF